MDTFDTRPKKKEVAELHTEAEMRESLKRCTLLLKNETILSRMPDKGKSIQQRFEGLIAHARALGMPALADEYGATMRFDAVAKIAVKVKAEEEDNDNAGAAPTSAASNSAVVKVKQEEVDDEEDSSNNNNNTDEFTPEQVSTYGMSLILKNRAVRGDIHKELQRMYASNLSQREIQRLADTSSPNLLMSYDDTLEMERRFAELERQAMMRRIRERLAAAGVSATDTAGGGNGGTLGTPAEDEEEQHDHNNNDHADHDDEGGIEIDGRDDE